ncbi:MAG: 16S rRNA (guanine(966)-N(2))-methyltransferase RsmD [Butyrivibrio sp.]|nr:16S rRNA (guanine(966)-N(2))-methyltransferase RsmD [Butyrivibrio sp.]
MRVIAGEARSIPLKTPEGKDTRPTQDRIKETLFNIIQLSVPGSIFVDVFAGSGGIGIEALSRGAKKAYFIENATEAVGCITANLHKTHYEEKGILLKQDVLVGLRNINEKEVDVIFIDPPYEGGFYEKTVSMLSKMQYVTEDTLIILEASLDEDFSFVENLGFKINREKLYKTNKHVFISREA